MKNWPLNSTCPFYENKIIQTADPRVDIPAYPPADIPVYILTRLYTFKPEGGKNL